jgi:hypothetical protein
MGIRRLTRCASQPDQGVAMPGGPTRRSAVVVAFLCALSACGGPADVGPEIEKNLAAHLDAQARSVAGQWHGVSVGLGLTFDLQEAGTAVSGGGTMTEEGLTNDSRYTVSGTYQRPQLTLTFTGMVYQGRVVEGRFQGNYDSIAGVGGTLHLKGTDYSKDIDLLLQEAQ